MLGSVASNALKDNSVGILQSALKNANVVGTSWMLSSALLTTYSTTKYLKFQDPPHLGKDHDKVTRTGSRLSRPTTLTILRFAGSLLIGLLAQPNFHIIGRIKETLSLLPSFSLPALFLFVANFTNSISLNRIGISLTYTSKCAIPLVTVLLTVLWDGVQALPPLPALLTLIPIAAGIATASWNHPTFEVFGFLAAFISLTAQSALNVICKHKMAAMGVSGPAAQRAMVASGVLMACALALFQIFSSTNKGGTTEADDFHPPAWLATMAAASYHIEYVLSFIFVGLVAPVTYSTCDAVRRLGIIVTGHFMFGGPPFTIVNIVGILLALGGALGYSVLH